MVRDLVILGTGGQGRECLDIVLAMVEDGADLNPVGFADDDPTPINKQLVEKRGLPILGTFDALLASPFKFEVCIGISSGDVRRRIDEQLRRANIPSPVLVHPASTLGSNVTVGPGSAVWAGARLTTNIKIGRHVHVNQNATIGHDSLLADYATVNPMAAISGNVRVGSGSTVGAGAVVLQGLDVGEDVVIGASACVIRSVPSGLTVIGVPARVHGGR